MYSDPSTLDATSIRLDHTVNSKLTLFAIERRGRRGKTHTIELGHRRFTARAGRRFTIALRVGRRALAGVSSRRSGRALIKAVDTTNPPAVRLHATAKKRVRLLR